MRTVFQVSEEDAANVWGVPNTFHGRSPSNVLEFPDFGFPIVTIAEWCEKNDVGLRVDCSPLSLPVMQEAQVPAWRIIPLLRRPFAEIIPQEKPANFSAGTLLAGMILMHCKFDAQLIEENEWIFTTSFQSDRCVWVGRKDLTIQFCVTNTPPNDRPAHKLCWG